MNNWLWWVILIDLKWLQSVNFFKPSIVLVTLYIIVSGIN